MSFCLSAIVHYSPEEMFRGALQAARDVTQGEWELGGWLLAIERTKAFEAAGFRGTVGFAMVRLGLEPQKATNLLRIMGALEGLPKLSEAFRSGEIGYGKIREITRVATEETEQAWLEFAHCHTTEQVRQRVVCSPSAFERRLRSVRARADGLLNYRVENEPPLPASSVPAAQTEATARSVGSVPGVGESEFPGLTLDPGPVLAGTPAEQDSVGQRNNPALEADGLPSPQRIHLGVDFSPEEYAEWQATVERVSRQFGRRVSHKDVILELVRRHVASTGGLSLERNPVVVRLEPAGTGVLQTDRGPLALSPQSAEDYLARASSVVVPGRPASAEPAQVASVLLLAGRRRKKPSADVLRALIARSEGCCEKCGHRGVLHIHHIQPVSRGGANCLSNLTLRCSACHTSEHRKDFESGSPWANARERRRRAAISRQSLAPGSRQKTGKDP